MALPLVIMLGWRSETHAGMTGDWFNWGVKLIWLKMALRDRWELFDFLSVILVVLLLMEGRRHPNLGFSRNLAFSGLVLLAGFLLLPRIIFGSAYADMRLVPYLFAVLILAIRERGEAVTRLATGLAIAGLVFAAARIGATTASLAMAAGDWEQKLEALKDVPMGARVASFVGLPCDDLWELPRNTHLGGMVIVRRHGFSNDQWIVEGANLLQLKHHEAGQFAADPSQIVRPKECAGGDWMPLDRSLELLPRDAFDYVWLIDQPKLEARAIDGMEVVWRGNGSILYRWQ
jgi:hypothetical protein